MDDEPVHLILSRYLDRELFTDPENWTPAPDQVDALNTMFGETIAWAAALKTLRPAIATHKAPIAEKRSFRPER